jgi:heat shock protein HspQ
MKSFRRTLSPVTKPFSYVHKTLVGLGFRKLENKSKPLYHLIFRNPDTNQSYTLYVSAQTLDNGQAEVMLPTARFEQESHVPLSWKLHKASS